MKYVIEDRDRHSNLRRYYWRKGLPKVRLRETPGTPEFATEVEAAIAIAMASKPICRPPGHYVYIIHAHGAGRVKIGISRNAEQRLANLQVGSELILRLARLYRVLSVDEARRIERAPISIWRSGARRESGSEFAWIMLPLRCRDSHRSPELRSTTC